MNDQTYSPIGKSKPANRIMVIVALLGLTVMALFIVFALVLGASDYAGDVSRLSAHQSEIVKIAEYSADHESASSSSKALAKSIQSLSASSVASLESLDGGTRISKDIVLEMQDQLSITALTSAGLTNNFNDKFVEVMSTKITDTINRTKLLVERVKKDEEKAIIAEILKNFEEILSELAGSSS